MFFNVPVLVMLAALRGRHVELVREIGSLARWREEVTDPVVESAASCVLRMIEEYSGRAPDSVVAIKLLPPGTKLFDFCEQTKEMVVSLYRFNRAEFDRYEVESGKVEFE